MSIGSACGQLGSWVTAMLLRRQTILEEEHYYRPPESSYEPPPFRPPSPIRVMLCSSLRWFASLPRQLCGIC